MTQFVLVRFGNVFGRRRQRDPALPGADRARRADHRHAPGITRYFMSLLEATQLLLQAGLQGRGGEILVLEMGEPVRIVDLARDMIRLSGADPTRSPSCSPACARARSCSRSCSPPRKPRCPTPHPKLRIARARAANPRFGRADDRLVRARRSPSAEVRARLKSWIPEYAPPAGAPVKPIPVESALRRGGRRRRCRCAPRASARPSLNRAAPARRRRRPFRCARSRRGGALDVRRRCACAARRAAAA